ncbi:MAG: 3-hydroxyacyl-CoA dehydrogenase/enoyl-CoA hydratase family protein [Oligoflexales bacterium]|nr:3-hydroxyacyl-CoA dehydrogenase/enoyl-CoA hydratase family protein [Oligoflexales bacterium]
MELRIQRVVVLGAGVMGSQIAAQLAGAGMRVHLLDMCYEEDQAPAEFAQLSKGELRSLPARKAIERLKSLKPQPYYIESDLQNLIPGNFVDDISVVAEADWVLEAIIEQKALKIDLLKKVAEYWRPGSAVTSNTSSLLIEELAHDLPDDVQKHFFGTHYFNPPRYMPLIEVIPHGASDEVLYKRFASWLETRLGKNVVVARDTVNFIANRIGCFNLQAKLKHADELGLSIAMVDLLSGDLIGHPSSAAYRTLDVVGLDTYALVTENVYKKAPEDPYRDYFKMPEWVSEMIQRGHCGQKSGQGFYKKAKNAQGESVHLAYNPERHEYESVELNEVAWLKEAKRIKDLPERLKFIFSHDDEYARFLWLSLQDTLIYCLTHIDHIAGGHPLAIDLAMRHGYNWQLGPFELWQCLGLQKTAAKLKHPKFALPSYIKNLNEFYHPAPASLEWENSGPQKQTTLPALKTINIKPVPGELHLIRNKPHVDTRIVASNPGASLLDLGDGIACLVFHSKMNTIDMHTLEMLQRSIALVSQNFQGMLIANDGKCFSAGAKLDDVAAMIDKRDFSALDRFIRNFQGTMQLLKFAPFATVACPHALTLGGGLELTLHASEIFSYAELNAGLVEANVGLIPAGGGLKELVLRCYAQMSLAPSADPTMFKSFLNRAFQLVSQALVSTSAKDAIEKKILPQNSYISISRLRQTFLAKSLLLSKIAFGYEVPKPVTKIPALGKEASEQWRAETAILLDQKKITQHDTIVYGHIADVLAGGSVKAGTLMGEQELLDLERAAFLDLCKTKATEERIKYMLANGRPLRN